MPLIICFLAHCAWQEVHVPSEPVIVEVEEPVEVYEVYEEPIRDVEVRAVPDTWTVSAPMPLPEARPVHASPVPLRSSPVPVRVSPLPIPQRPIRIESEVNRESIQPGKPRWRGMFNFLSGGRQQNRAPALIGASPLPTTLEPVRISPRTVQTSPVPSQWARPASIPAPVPMRPSSIPAPEAVRPSAVGIQPQPRHVDASQKPPTNVIQMPRDGGFSYGDNQRFPLSTPHDAEAGYSYGGNGSIPPPRRSEYGQHEYGQRGFDVRNGDQGGYDYGDRAYGQQHVGNYGHRMRFVP